jgi:pyruvate/2-oxoglutarate dehydrogenase complex dihydrolipoamide acyltransferase (E2) component
MHDLTVPKMGMDTTEVEILQWKVNIGDKIKKGDPVAEIEFEKATADVESDVAGSVMEILFKVGEIVKVGSIICRINTD